MDADRDQGPTDLVRKLKSLGSPSCFGLSAARRDLVALIQALEFGRVEGLRIVDGEPQFHPPPRLVQERKFGASRSSRSADRDFMLKATVIEMLEELDRVGTGEIEMIEVRGGLPFRLTMTVAPKDLGVLERSS